MTQTTDFAVQGFCADGFHGVRDVFAQNFADGLEDGASFAAYVDGQPVVDLWGGWMNTGRTRAWQRDTIVNMWSSTKAMLAICVNMLVDDGLIDPEQPVAKYWPEFAQNGKERITVGQMMSHMGALPDVSLPIRRETLYDWKAIVHALEVEAPWWEPGTLMQYHSITLGYLGGELVRRVSGKSVGTFFRERVADVVGADFHIGFGPEVDVRVADVSVMGEIPQVTSAPESVEARLQMAHLMMADFTVANSREWRAAEIPAANGHGNARSAARIMANLACGEIDGVRLLSDTAIAGAMVERGAGFNRASAVRWGIGFALSGTDRIPVAAGRRALTHSGAGGSLVVADLDARMGFAYAMNRMIAGAEPDPRADRLARSLYAAL